MSDQVAISLISTIGALVASVMAAVLGVRNGRRIRAVHHAVNLIHQGDTGKTGDQGARGDTGPKGDQGPAGYFGVRG